MSKTKRQIKSAQASFAQESQKLGGALTKTLTLPIGVFAVLAAKKFHDFELQMAKVKAVTQATEEEFASLVDTARKLGRETIFKASQVGALQLNLGKLGFLTQDINDTTEAVLALAQATDEPVARAAEVLGKNIRAFGLSFKESGRVADVMTKSFTSTALNLERFAESIKMVAPIAAQVGSPIELVTAQLGQLNNAGIEATIAGTGLRKIYTDLGKEGENIHLTLGELAKTNFTLAKSKELVGQRAAAALLVLVKQHEAVTKLNASLIDSAGAAEKMQAIMNDTLAGDWKRFLSVLESIQLSMSGIFSDNLRGVTRGMTSLGKAFESLPKGMKTVVAWSGIVAASLGPLLLLGVALSKSIKLIHKLVTSAKLGFPKTVGHVSRLFTPLKGIARVIGKIAFFFLPGGALLKGLGLFSKGLLLSLSRAKGLGKLRHIATPKLGLKVPGTNLRRAVTQKETNVYIRILGAATMVLAAVASASLAKEIIKLATPTTERQSAREKAKQKHLALLRTQSTTTDEKQSIREQLNQVVDKRMALTGELRREKSRGSTASKKTMSYMDALRRNIKSVNPINAEEEGRLDALTQHFKEMSKLQQEVITGKAENRSLERKIAIAKIATDTDKKLIGVTNSFVIAMVRAVQSFRELGIGIMGFANKANVMFDNLDRKIKLTVESFERFADALKKGFGLPKILANITIWRKQLWEQMKGIGSWIGDGIKERLKGILFNSSVQTHQNSPRKYDAQQGANNNQLPTQATTSGIVVNINIAGNNYEGQIVSKVAAAIKQLQQNGQLALSQNGIQITV